MATNSTTLSPQDPPMEGVATTVHGKLVLSQGLTRALDPNSVGGQFVEIPAIDLTPLTKEFPTTEETEKLVQDLRDACMRVGFFVIKNHGISWDIVERAFAASKQFFALPTETKRKYHESLSATFMGYEEPYYTNVDRLKKGG